MTDLSDNSPSDKQIRLLAELKPGNTIDDFEIIQPLGRGAFASVFLARQISLQRLVALKVSTDHSHEPQMLAQLDHPFIVRVFDQRQIEGTGLRLLYMQFVPGGTVRDLIHLVRSTPMAVRNGGLVVAAVEQAIAGRSDGPSAFDSSARKQYQTYTWPEAVCLIGARLATALEHAHRQGVLHRDIKPANVLLAADGTPKLADFNISYSARIDEMVPSAYFGGSLFYMSPEQLEATCPFRSRDAAELDSRSDIYSLAVLLWELLTGTRPFDDGELSGGLSETIDRLLANRRSGVREPRPIPNDEMALRITSVIHRALSYDRELRTKSAARFGQELLRCLLPGNESVDVEPGGKVTRFISRHPLTTITLIHLIPNAIGGASNYWYNRSFIIEQVSGSESAFWTTQFFVNAIAFPLGTFAILNYFWPFLRCVRNQIRNIDDSPETLARARRIALKASFMASLIAIAEWIVAGLAFPLALSLSVPKFPFHACVHFLVSSAVCGLIAAVFPYLGATAAILRYYYPRLLGDRIGEPGESARLRATARQAGIYIFLAGGVPLFGLLLLTLAGADNRAASLVLIAAGLVGLLFAYSAYAQIRDRIEILLRATDPAATLTLEP